MAPSATSTRCRWTSPLIWRGATSLTVFHRGYTPGSPGTEYGAQSLSTMLEVISDFSFGAVFVSYIFACTSALCTECYTATAGIDFLQVHAGLQCPTRLLVCYARHASSARWGHARIISGREIMQHCRRCFTVRASGFVYVYFLHLDRLTRLTNRASALC